VTAAEIAQPLGNTRPEGKDWRRDCPLCQRHNLTLYDGDRHLLVHCFNGCDGVEVLAELRRRGFYGAGNGATRPPVETRGEA